jgi:hypothetical protein
MSTTISEFRLASKCASTVSTNTALKAQFYHRLGRLAWEDKAVRMIQYPGYAIVRMGTSRRGSKASWALSSVVPLRGNYPSSELHVMPVTSIGDVRHGRSTELQATMRTIEA